MNNNHNVFLAMNWVWVIPNRNWKDSLNYVNPLRKQASLTPE